MIDCFTPQLGSDISAQIDLTSGGSADQLSKPINVNRQTTSVAYLQCDHLNQY